MRKIKVDSINCLMFEYEDLRPLNSQIFITKGYKKKYVSYQEFCSKSLSIISLLDSDIEFDQTDELIYDFIEIEKGRSLVSAIYSYLKVNISNSKYDFLSGKEINSYVTVFNRTTEIFVLCITKQEYIALYWLAT